MWLDDKPGENGMDYRLDGLVGLGMWALGLSILATLIYTQVFQ